MKIILFLSHCYAINNEQWTFRVFHLFTRWDWLRSLTRLRFHHLTCLRFRTELFLFMIFSTFSFALMQLFFIYRLSSRSSRNHYLTLSLFNMHAHLHDLKFSSLHRHLEIWHYMLRHRSYFESQRVSSRNCRNWTKSIRTTKNSRIQTTILTSNWRFSSISVNVSNYHHMRTWKKRHSCLRKKHYLIFMTINMKTSHSTNVVSI
jgi:hypothetical protein